MELVHPRRAPKRTRVATSAAVNSRILKARFGDITTFTIFCGSQDLL